VHFDLQFEFILFDKKLYFHLVCPQGQTCLFALKTYIGHYAGDTSAIFIS